jgi:transcriptional regulator with XRE-family HTH domain
VSEKSKWTQELQDKETRDAFVSSQVSIPIAFQILALREQRGWTQKQLAEKAGMLQPRIAAMERPSGSEPNLRTLKRFASAFDVALIVRFAPFSELVEWAGRFSPDTFIVPSFDEDCELEEVTAGLEADRASADPDPMKLALVMTYGAVGEYQRDDRPAKRPASHEHVKLILPRLRPLVARDDTRGANRSTFGSCVVSMR